MLLWFLDLRSSCFYFRCILLLIDIDMFVNLIAYIVFENKFAVDFVHLLFASVLDTFLKDVDLCNILAD